jgi:hypothetical protein
MGLEPLYQEFQNVEGTTQKEIDASKIYDKTITIGKREKDINLITDIPDAYPIVVMESITDYLLKKYGKTPSDRKLALLIVSPIVNFTTKYKQINPSTHGKRITELFSSLSRYVEAIRNRTTMQKLTSSGKNDSE